MEMVIGLSASVLLIALVAAAWRWDIHKWNGGFCRQCSYKLVRFDTDSQGGRMYKCTNPAGAHYGPDISYPYVDKNYEHPKAA